MKGFLTWLKANILIVILGILTVVPLPVAWYIAGGMNSKLREERQSEASKAYRDIEGANVTYTLPVLSEDGEPIADQGPPNAIKTEFYRAEREKREAMVAAVKERAVAFNAKNHGALVEGLFPEPARGAPAQLLPFEMAKRVQATGGETGVSAYDELFQRLRIRPALDPDFLREQIGARKAALMTQMAPGIAENEIDEIAWNQIVQKLVEQRLGALETHARDTSFYADSSVLPLAVPRTVPTVAPSLVACFNWQADYWLVSDVLSALASANDRFDTRGVGGNVIDGVVKRVESISFGPFVSAQAMAQAQGAEVGGEVNAHGERVAAQPTRSSGPSAEAVFGESFTGRNASEGDLYDVRKVKVTLIASYEKLPALIDSISSYNLMTVLDADIYAVDAWDQIEQGYYAGTDYPVRVELEIETLWLRSWTKAFMPPEIRAALGIADETASEEDPA